MQTIGTKIALFFLLLLSVASRAQSVVQVINGGTGSDNAAAAAAALVNGNPIAPSSIAQNVAILPAGSQPSGTLAAALTTYGANTEIILPPSYSETVATQIAMNAANVTLKCEPGATLTQSSSLTTAAMIAVTANNVTITGCNINANSVNLNNSSFVGTVYIAPGVSNFTASYNNMYNIESLGFNPVGTTNTVIDHNYMTSLQISGSNSGVGVFAFNTTGYTLTGLQITNNAFLGSGAQIMGLAAGQTVNGFIFSGNTGVISLYEQTLLTAGDFSGTKNSLVLNGVITNNTCTLVGPSSATEPWGCFTFSEGIGWTVSNNTAYAAGQYVVNSIFESGLMNSTFSGNTIYAGSDPGTQSYPDFIEYLGGNTFADNNIYGFGENGAAYEVYANTISYDGGAVNANNNSFIGGNLIGTSPFGVTSQAVEVYCATSGGSATGTKIQGLNIVGAFDEGIHVEDATAGSCPTSASIDTNTINGSNIGIYLYDATANIGPNTYTGVTTNLLDPVGVTINPDVFVTPVQIGAGSPITSSGPGGAMASGAYASTTGGGAAVPTGPTSSINGDAVVYTGTSGQQADAGFKPAQAVACTTVSTLSPASNGCYQLSTSSSVAMPAASAFTIFVVQTESSATATFTGVTLSSDAGCSSYLSGSTLALTGNHKISVQSDGTNVWASCI